MKVLFKILLVICGVIGAIINLIFYLDFFKTLEYPVYIYAPISVIITIICAAVYLVAFKEKNYPLVSLGIILSMFSIFCNFSVQLSDAKIKINRQIAMNDLELSEEKTNNHYQEQIDRLTREYESLAAQKKATLNSLDDRYEYKNTTAGAEKRQDKILNDIKHYENLIATSSPRSSTVKMPDPDIFDSFSSDPLEKLQYWIVFIIALSVVLELITPVCGYLYFSINNHVNTLFKKPSPFKNISLEKNASENKPAAIIGFRVTDAPTRPKKKKQVHEDDMKQGELF